MKYLIPFLLVGSLIISFSVDPIANSIAYSISVLMAIASFIATIWLMHE